MRAVPEVEQLIERTEAKIAGLKKDERAARKDKSAFAPLTRCGVQLRIVDAEEDLISLQREKLGARIEEIDAELIAVGESEGLAVQEPPASGSRQAQLEIEEAQIRESLDSPRWNRERRALLNRKRQIEADRALEATEQADAIVAELTESSRKVAADTDEAVQKVIRPLQERWRAIGAAWMQYERALGVAAVGRLDAGEFPIQVGQITAPIPRPLDPDHDPTITTPVPTA